MISVPGNLVHSGATARIDQPFASHVSKKQKCLHGWKLGGRRGRQLGSQGSTGMRFVVHVLRMVPRQTEAMRGYGDVEFVLRYIEGGPSSLLLVF